MDYRHSCNRPQKVACQACSSCRCRILLCSSKAGLGTNLPPGTHPHLDRKTDTSWYRLPSLASNKHRQPVVISLISNHKAGNYKRRHLYLQDIWLTSLCSIWGLVSHCAEKGSDDLCQRRTVAGSSYDVMSRRSILGFWVQMMGFWISSGHTWCCLPTTWTSWETCSRELA